MKKLSSWYLSTAFLLATFSQAAFANTTKTEEVKTYLDLSGINLVLESVPSQIQAMSQQMQLTEKDPVQAQEFMNVLISSWDEQKIQYALIDNIKSSFSTDEIKQLNTWLKTDLAQKIKLAEQKSSSSSFNQDFMQYMSKIQSTPPNAERVASVRHFIESTHLVDHTLEMILGISKGLTKTLQASEGVVITEEQLATQMQQMEGMMKPQLEEQMIYVSYYTYEEISDEDIHNYSDFYNTPLGQKELNVMSKSIGHSFGLWVEDAMKNIDDLVGDK